MTSPSDHGTIFIAKAPEVELTHLGGIVPIQVRHEVYEHPSAPVIRTVLTLLDLPRTPLVLEAFYDVADPGQRADFEALADQDELYLLFYDQNLTHRLTKRVSSGSRALIPFLLGRAEGLLYDISPDQYDFDRAKADLQARVDL